MKFKLPLLPVIVEIEKHFDTWLLDYSSIQDGDPGIHYYDFGLGFVTISIGFIAKQGQ